MSLLASLKTPHQEKGENERSRSLTPVVYLHSQNKSKNTIKDVTKGAGTLVIPLSGPLVHDYWIVKVKLIHLIVGLKINTFPHYE